MLSRLGCVLALCLLAMPALAQKQGGTLRVTHRDNPPSASIHEEATISTVMPFMAVFNNLVVFDPDSPAEPAGPGSCPTSPPSWKWSDDDRTLTFQLRDGVKWHDGKPFTSADVKCTWDIADPARRTASCARTRTRPWWFNIKDIATNGDREVIFHLNDPQPSIMAMFAGGFSPIYPCHVPAAADAHPSDRHRPVQVRRVQAERIDPAGAQPGLLEAGPAVSRRDRVHHHPEPRDDDAGLGAGQEST